MNQDGHVNFLLQVMLNGFLGDLQAKICHACEYHELIVNSGAMFARNPYNTEFGRRVAFFQTDESSCFLPATGLNS